MKKQLRILVVGDFRPKSGLTEFIFQTFGKLGKDYLIDVISYGGKDDLDEEISNFSWGKYTVTSIHKSILKHLFDWIKVLKLCNKKKYDIIHFNYSSSWNFLPVLFTKMLLPKIKIVIHSHSSYYSNSTNSRIKLFILNALNSFGRKIFNHCSDMKVATSESAAIWMFGNRKVDEVRIISNGIDLKKYEFSVEKRKRVRNKIKIFDEETKVLGFVGALRELKNPEFVVDIFEDFKKLNDNSVLLIFGDGPLKQELEKKIKENKILSDCVFLKGVVNNIPDILQAMDYFVFPSKYEGYGLALAEAEASGLHSIVSTGIPKKVVVNRLTKMVSLDKNSEYWANQIAKDINYRRESEYENLYNLGFDVSETIKKIDEIYRSMI